MSAPLARGVVSIVLRALGIGILAMLVIPLVLAFTLLGLSHLVGGCGAGSSGGCEMGAAAVGLYAMPFAFFIAAVASLVRDMRKPAR